MGSILFFKSFLFLLILRREFWKHDYKVFVCVPFFFFSFLFFSFLFWAFKLLINVFFNGKLKHDYLGTIMYAGYYGVLPFFFFSFF
jgi:hypothetical protein